MNLSNIKNDLENLLYEMGDILKTGYVDKNKMVTTKSDANDLLTKYDIEINTKIVSYLTTHYPDISIVSEELEDIFTGSKYAFLVDPIDGTRNFVRNIPLFHVGIGLIYGNKTILSVTYNPITGDMFSAIQGEGTFKNGIPVKVSNRELHLCDINIRTLPNKKLEKEVVNDIIENVHQVKNNMCTHEEISGVASDKYDASVSKGSSVWDYCHYLLVEEAGGKVTDWKGEEFNLSKDNIIVSNSIIHDILVDVTKKYI